MNKTISRRQFLTQAIQKGPVLATGLSLLQVSAFAQSQGFTVEGPLQTADSNGLRLPKGFVSRIVARSGQSVSGSQYLWHKSPDGGACFATLGGGWVYVSNSEEYYPDAGAGVIAFDGQGEIKTAYRILHGTVGNCAGGATPWQTWLSCEEIDCGAVYETDPMGIKRAVKQPALGFFKHEAVAVDADRGQLYLTEDEKDGCLYRFTPAKPLPDLNQGLLEVAIVDKHNNVGWQVIDAPNPSLNGPLQRTRYQVKAATPFKGGEGIWYQKGLIMFATKRDNRIWVLNIESQSLQVLYDVKEHDPTLLSGVDNLAMTPEGQILVAEDGGHMQLVLLDVNGKPKPLLQVTGQSGSELTGPAFSPDGSRLYFSSQRGLDSEKRLGITYEVRRA